MEILLACMDGPVRPIRCAKYKLTGETVRVLDDVLDDDADQLVTIESIDGRVWMTCQRNLGHA
jgi:hypothetical protein